MLKNKLLQSKYIIEPVFINTFQKSEKLTHKILPDRTKNIDKHTAF